ncbi:MAG TPA: tRNA (guanosine(37)-N1)-methyltransferase TrmD [candidate division Zixibacteria bacterium]|nr:tRNA (guanosine(37)-N1)-methyltransferase TrmD [candidate division Zixibacteria bacterium]
MLTFTVITLFPSMLESPLGHSILKKAQEKELISVSMVDPRDYTADRHRIADDYPYGGGHGMVMKPEPLVASIEDVRRKSPGARVILLCPQGRVFDQAVAARLARENHVVLVCGRYEGVDERVKAFVDEELSIGDYTLSGGEPAALVVIDAVARLVAGVLGNERSAAEESFVEGLLEYPQYTRPEEFRGMRVPDVLLSGDHERIRRWRRRASVALTAERRPDLLARARLSAEEKAEALKHRAPVYLALLHHPVYDKNGRVVTTAVTNMDIHDIARAARTYGVRALYVVTPVKALQKLSLKIIEHWETGYGAEYNATRKEALALARVTDALDDVLIDVERESGIQPAIVATSARTGPGRASFPQVRDMLIKSSRPVLILFGTGWGLTDEILSRADYILEPVEGCAGYNHLSVRSAAAIILDRLLRY